MKTVGTMHWTSVRDAKEGRNEESNYFSIRFEKFWDSLSSSKYLFVVVKTSISFVYISRPKHQCTFYLY